MTAWSQVPSRVFLFTQGGEHLLSELWRNRHLISSLTRRQFHVRYRQSFGGFLWAVIPPLATLAVAVVIFNRVAGIKGCAGSSYAVCTLAGLAPWSLFASSLTFGIPSIVEQKMMITRLAFPRATLPLSMVGTAVIDFCVAVLIFLAFLFATGGALAVAAAWFPVVVLLELMLVLGVVLLGSALNVFARDVRLAVPLGVQLWLFLTPVMYPLSSVEPGLRGWYMVNPMTGVAESFRAVMVYGEAPDPQLLGSSAAGALILLLLGFAYFRVTERRFADAI